MNVDVGLDAAGLSYDAEMEVAAYAARRGYGHIWVGSVAYPFKTCAFRWAATRDAVPGGIGTAIGVMPAGVRTPAGLTLSAAALSHLTEGRFILGIGAGSAYEPSYRRTWGIEERSSLALVRAYLITLRGFLAGESVTYRGSGLRYDNARLPARPARTPLYVGAVGPEMARLAGELADGLYLSWCTAEQVSQTREQIAEGAARAGRDPAAVTLAASVRVSVDDDVHAARRALAGALLPYVRGWDGTPPRAYRAAFERMGFGPDLAEIDRVSASGAAHGQIIEAFPERMLRGLGYFGPAAGAGEALRQFAGAADVAVVRLVPSRPGAETIRTILDACRPDAMARYAES